MHFFKALGFAGSIIGSQLLKLNFAVTRQCNSRCKTCHIWRNSFKKEEELSLEESRVLFEKNAFLKWISFTGGEPFCRNDLAGLANAAFDSLKGLYILNIPTNGSMPKKIEKIAEEIALLGIPHFFITVSIDGPEKIHDSVRGVKGSWKNAVDTLQRLKQLEQSHKNFKAMPAFTISPFNSNSFFPALKELSLEIPSININSFSFSFYESSNHYYKNSSLKPSQSRQFNESTLSSINKITNNRMLSLKPAEMLCRAYLSFLKKRLNNAKLPKCRALSLSLFLDSNGDVFPCIVFSQKIGNVRKDGFDLNELLKSKKALMVKRKIAAGNCPHCWTPCEANQAMLSSPLKTIKHFFLNE